MSGQQERTSSLVGIVASESSFYSLGNITARVSGPKDRRVVHLAHNAASAFDGAPFELKDLAAIAAIIEDITDNEVPNGL